MIYFRLNANEIKQRVLIPGKKILEDHPDVKVPEEELKRIDFILVYQERDEDEEELTEDEKIKLVERRELRDRFEEELLESGFALQFEQMGKNFLVKIHAPFVVLCLEAEICALDMPLAGVCNETHKNNIFIHLYYDWIPCVFLQKKVEYDDKESRWQKFENKYLKTDTEEDFISAPFQLDRIHLYENNQDPDNFFRPAMRSFLVNHKLKNLDIRPQELEEDKPFAKQGKVI